MQRKGSLTFRCRKGLFALGSFGAEGNSGSGDRLSRARFRRLLLSARRSRAVRTDRPSLCIREGQMRLEKGQDDFLQDRDCQLRLEGLLRYALQYIQTSSWRALAPIL